mgnify:CR=1 FL=1
MSATKDLTIRKGATFAQTLRWEAPPIVWKPITAISLTAPVRLTVPAHGCPPNWRVNVSSNKSMREMDGVKGLATVIDADTIEINTINASGFKPYKGDGYLSFNTPVDMTAMTARMSIKDKVGGTELLRLDTTNNGLVIDATECSITMRVDASVTELLTWERGVYDIEVVDSLDTVHVLLSGKVTVTPEVTT